MYKYQFGGKRRTLSIGPYPTITLAIARDRRVDARRLPAEGTARRSTNSGARRKARLHLQRHPPRGSVKMDGGQALCPSPQQQRTKGDNEAAECSDPRCCREMQHRLAQQVERCRDARQRRYDYC